MMRAQCKDEATFQRRRHNLDELADWFDGARRRAARANSPRARAAVARRQGRRRQPGAADEPARGQGPGVPLRVHRRRARTATCRTRRSIEEGRLDEERRLLYVGITRAKEAAVAVARARSQRWGERQRNLPSRFLDELPAAELQRDGADPVADAVAQAGARERRLRRDQGVAGSLTCQRGRRDRDRALAPRLDRHASADTLGTSNRPECLHAPRPCPVLSVACSCWPALRPSLPQLASAAPAADGGRAIAPNPAARRHLNATVWFQTSVERDLVFRADLPRRRRDGWTPRSPTRRWDALPKDDRDNDPRALPPAIIVDVDETVLDNSPNQARLIRGGSEFNDAALGRVGAAARGQAAAGRAGIPAQPPRDRASPCSTSATATRSPGRGHGRQPAPGRLPDRRAPASSWPGHGGRGLRAERLGQRLPAATGRTQLPGADAVRRPGRRLRRDREQHPRRPPRRRSRPTPTGSASAGGRCPTRSTAPGNRRCSTTTGSSPRPRGAPPRKRRWTTRASRQSARCSSARYSADCISIRREAVRSNAPRRRSPRVQQRRRRGGAADQVDVAVVQLVDQGHEAARGIVVARVQARDAAEQHGVELARDLDVVAGRARAFAQRGEVEPGHALAARAHRDPAAVDLDAAGRGAASSPPSSCQRVAARRRTRHPAAAGTPASGSARAGGSPAGCPGARPRNAASISAIAGRKRARCRPSLYSSRRRGVGAGHQHHAFGEQALEQAPEQHRVADVADEELVQHQHPQLRRAIRARSSPADRARRRARAGARAPRA